ncbi:MAG: FtsX-like permease family protein [Acidobacteriota bacterium]
MELGPIFRALFHNRTRFVLISLEVALTLAIVVNCVNLILDLQRTMNRPSGMDEENLVVLTLRPHGTAFVDDDYAKSVREDDLRLVQSLPGVVAASFVQSVPLSGSGSATGRKAMDSELDSVTAPYFEVSQQAVETFGAEIVAGRDFTAEDFRTDPNQSNVIVSQKMADLFFPEGDALGQQITNNRGTAVHRIIGITSDMLNSWPDSPVADRVVLFPVIPDRKEYYYIVARARPGTADELYLRVEEALIASNSERQVEVQHLAEVRAESFRQSRVTIQLLTGVMALLVLVTALGIVGLTSFSVTQRTRQIGVRRALGATRGAILRYFLTENWIITTLGIGVGIGLAYLLSYGLMHYADGAELGFDLIASGAIVLWVVGLLAALMPALRGTRVAPVVATRSV